MKIDSDLRLAVRAAAKTQPQRNYQQEQDLQKKEVQRFLTSTPERAALHRKHQKNLLRARSLIADAEKFYGQFGLQSDGIRVWSDEKYKAAGGKLPPERSTWRAEKVLGELAAATPAEGKAILKKYGINWE